MFQPNHHNGEHLVTYALHPSYKGAKPSPDQLIIITDSVTRGSFFPISSFSSHRKGRNTILPGRNPTLLMTSRRIIFSLFNCLLLMSPQLYPCSQTMSMYFDLYTVPSELVYNIEIIIIPSKDNITGVSVNGESFKPFATTAED